MKELQFVRCQIKCKEHGIWFDSPIYFGTPQAYYNAFTHDNITTCPYGGEIVPCDKDNVRFEYRDGKGKVIYEDGKDPY